jgi:hypothetical protein
MINKNIILLPAHISKQVHVQALERCINSVRKYSTYPILLVFSGDITLMKDTIGMVDEYIYTSVNTLLDVDTQLYEFYKTDNWRLEYKIPSPRRYHGYANMQKVALGLETALNMGYNNILNMNYDTIVMDAGFIDYMFSEEKCVFFKYREDETFTSTDVFKLNVEGANIIKQLGNYEVYKKFSHNVPAEMVEHAVTAWLNESKLDIRKLLASNLGNAYFPLQPFNVAVNTVSNSDVFAVLVNDIVHIVVSSNGSPRHTTDGKIEIECNGTTTVFDVSSPMVTLFPLVKYENKPIDISVATSMGKFPVTIGKHILENSSIQFYT